MKKILLGLFTISAITMASELTQDLEKTNIYLRAGIDPYGSFNEIKHENVNITKRDRDNLGYELSIEATQKITPNIELGLGLGYQDHGSPKASKNADKKHGYNKLPRFESIPLYMTAKYNVPLESKWNPYIKTDLGYSFNIKSEETLYSTKENNLKAKYKDGMYWGVGFGIEHNNIVADLMYKMNYGKVKFTKTTNGKSENKNSKIDYGRITLSVGYKFNF